MKAKFILLILVIPWLITGCASNEQFVHFPDQSKTVEDPAKGRIYVIRPKLAGMGIASEICDDGKSIGSTCPRGFLCWERPPGMVVLTGTTDTTNELSVQVEAGEVSYIFQTIEFGWIRTDNQLALVSESEGTNALAKCKPPVCYFISDQTKKPATK